MNRAQIVVSHWVHQEVLEFLRKFGDVAPNRTRDTISREDLMDRARSADALMAFMPDRIDDEFLAACPKLKAVACAFKGADNVDIDACSRRGIWVSLIPDLLTGPTAELAVGLMLALLRKIVVGDAVVRWGKFAGWRPLYHPGTLQARRVGVLGMGALGQAIAQRLLGFECVVRYADPRPLEARREAELRVEAVEFEELLRSSDLVVVAAPLTPHTLHRIDRRSLALLPRGAAVVNVGRGSIVDEEAVAEALSDGRLGGYAADVFEMEDLSRPDRPSAIPEALLEMSDSTVFTPHLGSAVEEVRCRIAFAAARNLADALTGLRPRDAANDLLTSLTPESPRP